MTRLCCLMRVCGVSHTLKSAAPVNVCYRAQLSPLSFSLSFPNSLWYHTLILTLSLNHSAKAAHTPSILAAQSKSQTHTQTQYNSFYRRDIGAGDKKEKERDTFYVSMTEVEQEEDERQVRSHFKYWDDDSHKLCERNEGLNPTAGVSRNSQRQTESVILRSNSIPLVN